jgi:hypothetical protein
MMQLLVQHLKHLTIAQIALLLDVVAEYIAANQSSPHSLDAVINKQLNEALYDRLIADAKKAPNPGVATAYLNVARRLKSSNRMTVI